MKIELFITRPDISNSVILIDGVKQFHRPETALETWVESVEVELDKAGCSEVMALLNFNREPESKPLLFSKDMGLLDSPAPRLIAEYGFVLCRRSDEDNRWDSEMEIGIPGLRAILALILWDELPTEKRFTPEVFGGRKCLICGRTNYGQSIGFANMSGHEMFSFTPHCEWPDCFSHRLQKFVNSAYNPDFTAHNERFRASRN